MVRVILMGDVSPFAGTSTNIVVVDPVPGGQNPTWRIDVDHLIHHRFYEERSWSEYEKRVVLRHSELLVDWQVNLRVDEVRHD